MNANEAARDFGLPHVEILKRATELKKSGRLERLRAAAIEVAARKIKQAKSQT